MKHTFVFLLTTVVLLSSCSTAYKAAQTPDDVYYSPAKEVTTYAQKNNTPRDRYQENINSQDDRFLRMKIQNPDRWQQIDDFNYWYDPRYDFNAFNRNFNNFNGFNGFNNFNFYGNNYSLNNWNRGFYNQSFFSPNYFGFSGFYNPCYTIVYYKNPKVYTGVTGKSNLATYINSQYNNQNTNYTKGQGSNNFGNLVKRVFTTPNDNNSNSSYDRPARSSNSTSQPSNSAGGRSGGYSSSGSSSAPSRPPRN